MILKTDNITMQFGGVTAVNLLNIEINEHEIVALIGPNGAGKTTAFNMITGVYTPTSGDVIYVGCGERAWPSMNNQEGNTQSNDGTWYALRVVNVCLLYTSDAADD